MPQELAFDMFARVDHSVEYSRGMFGCPPSKARIEEVLRSLSLWDKREAKIRELSGGMKRRVMIAKALSHDPELLFLDEPTAGVDVELRRDMWKQIGELREKGTTIILTTHYIEEAQEMADRVGVINKGKLLLVDDKDAIMAKLGRTEARISLSAADDANCPASLARFPLSLESEGKHLRLSWRRRHREGQARDRRSAAPAGRAGHRLRRRRNARIDARGHLRRPGREPRRGRGMNLRGALAIFTNELARFFRTVFGSILSPVLTTSLYIVVFGAAIGKRMDPSQFGGSSPTARSSCPG